MDDQDGLDIKPPQAHSSKRDKSHKHKHKDDRRRDRDRERHSDTASEGFFLLASVFVINFVLICTPLETPHYWCILYKSWQQYIESSKFLKPIPL